MSEQSQCRTAGPQPRARRDEGSCITASLGMAGSFAIELAGVKLSLNDAAERMVLSFRTLRTWRGPVPKGRKSEGRASRLNHLSPGQHSRAAPQLLARSLRGWVVVSSRRANGGPMRWAAARPRPQVTAGHALKSSSRLDTFAAIRTLMVHPCLETERYGWGVNRIARRSINAVRIGPADRKTTRCCSAGIDTSPIFT